ncbi:MAG TPA: S8 family serine peptidase [Steroidobacteraceae bacterium]
MSSPTRTGRLVWQTATTLAALLFLNATAAAAATDWQSRLTPRLLALWIQQNGEAAEKSAARGPSAREAFSAARFDAAGRVQIDVRFDCSSPAPTKALAAAGLVIGAVVHVAPLCSVEGWLRMSDLAAVAAGSAVHSIDLPMYSKVVGPVMHLHEQAQVQAAATIEIDGNGVSITNAAQYIQSTGKNGSGVTIGVLSDDVTSVAIIQARGELPAHIANLTPTQQSPNPTPTDEGTMLLEELYAIAPGASLAFCAPETDVEYVSCLRDFITAGVSIVADDLEYPAEDLLSTKSTLAQSVQTLLAQNPNLMLLSAAGNENKSFWQGVYAPTQLAQPFSCSANGQADAYAQTFDGDRLETITLLEQLTAPIYMQWADPAGQNSSNFDLYVLDQHRTVIECLASASTRNSFVASLNPNLGKGTYHFAIATPGVEFAGKFLKLIAYGNGSAIFSTPTAGAIASPQKLVAGVVTVGAVYGGDGVGSNIEPFSANGPAQLEFPTAVAVQAPVLVAPDAVYVDADSTDFTTGSTGLFYGTSAATPNVAAVAALLRAAFPTLSAQRIVAALTSGAAPLGVGATPDGVFGYGRVDALGALKTLASPTIGKIANVTVVGGTTSAAIPITLAGTGFLTLKGSSDNSALVAFAGTLGAQFAPTTCGNATYACTLSVTPAIGLIGTAHLGISVTDGAGRATSTTFTVTVTTPAPPTVKVTAGGTQSVPSGNNVTPVTVALSGVKNIAVTLTSSNTALLPASSATLSSGCGSTSLTCTVSLRPISGQLGQATLTVTARDSYGQTAHNSASLTIVAAPTKSGGGGGAFDLYSLAGLSLLMLTGLVRKPRHLLAARVKPTIITG